MIRSSKVQYFLGLGTCVHSWVLGHWREPARGMTGQKRNMFQNFQHHLEELIFVHWLHQRWLRWFKQKVQYRQFAYLWFIMVQHLIDFCQKMMGCSIWRLILLKKCKCLSVWMTCSRKYLETLQKMPQDSCFSCFGVAKCLNTSAKIPRPQKTVWTSW